MKLQVEISFKDCLESCYTTACNRVGAFIEIERMSLSMDDVIRSIIGSRTLLEALDELGKLGLSNMSAQTLLELPRKEISGNTKEYYEKVVEALKDIVEE